MFKKAGEGRSEGDERKSVYERVLGADFAELHPGLRSYFGAIPEGLEGVGSGRYREAGLRLRVLRPLFAVLGRRQIAFAERGTDVPFTVSNVMAADGVLRATRRFRFATATRQMTDAMRVVDGRLVDRIGRSGEVEVDLAIRVEGGGLRMESRRLALRIRGLRIPIPRVIGLTLRETVDDDGVQHIEVRVRAPLVGEVYGYVGAFRYALRPVGRAAAER